MFFFQNSLRPLVFSIFVSFLISPVWAVTAVEAEKLLSMGEYQQALIGLDKEAMDPAETLFIKASALQGLNRDDEAIGIYKQLINQYPENPEPYNNLAAIYVKRQDFTKALELLESAISQHEAYRTIFNNQRSIYRNMASRQYVRALQVKKSEKLLQLSRLHSMDRPQTMEASATQATPVVATPVNGGSNLKPVAALPEKEVTKIEQSGLESEVERLVFSWADAWRSQDIRNYINAYVRNYAPDRQTGHQGWVRLRTKRLRKPTFIKIDISDLQVSRSNGSEFIAEFVIAYQSNSYQDRSRKRLIFTPDKNTQMKIVSEVTVEVL